VMSRGSGTLPKGSAQGTPLTFNARFLGVNE